MIARRALAVGSLLVAALVAVGALVWALRPAPYALCTSEQRALFELLDEFVPPDEADQPFVRVWAAPWLPLRREGSRAYEGFPFAVHGFLLSRRGNQVLVRGLDGERALLPDDSPGHSAGVRRGCDEASLAEYAKDLAAEAELNAWSGVHPFHAMPPEFRLLVAARSLARRGDSSNLAAVWATIPAPWRALPQAGLAKQPLAVALANRLALDLADPSLRWPDLRRRHERWLAHCDGDWTGADHVAEDVAVRLHGIVAVLEEPSPSRGDRAGLLRVQLRAVARQQMHTIDVPVTVTRLEPVGDELSESLEPIVGRGLDVVPALIALLEDRTPTRSTYFGGRKRTPYVGVDTVGVLAADALEEIAGGCAIVDKTMLVRRSADDWKAWHGDMQRTGLAGFLIERVRAGGYYGEESARSFVRLFPGEIDRLLLAAQPLPPEDAVRLLAVAWPVVRGRAASLATWRAQLGAIARSTTPCRSEAALLLLASGDRSGISTLHQCWQRGEAMDRDDYAALFWGGEPSIWNELRARLDDETLRATFATAVRTTTLDGLLLDADARDQPGIEACVRECLLRLLADATPLDRDYLGEALWHRGEFVALHRATRADVAACALSSWWPGEFSFDPKATGSGRARQVAAMLASRGVSAPASAARVPGAGPDEIGPIEFVGALPTGSYAARDRLTALVGRRLAEKELIIAMRAFAAACACTVALHLERSHDGAGWSLQCEVGATSSARARSTNDAGWMTMRGRCGSLRSAGDFPIFIVPSAGAVEMTLVFR